MTFYCCEQSTTLPAFQAGCYGTFSVSVPLLTSTIQYCQTSSGSKTVDSVAETTTTICSVPKFIKLMCRFQPGWLLHKLSLFKPWLVPVMDLRNCHYCPGSDNWTPYAIVCLCGVPLPLQRCAVCRWNWSTTFRTSGLRMPAFSAKPGTLHRTSSMRRSSAVTSGSAFAGTQIWWLTTGAYASMVLSNNVTVQLDQFCWKLGTGGWRASETGLETCSSVA